MFNTKCVACWTLRNVKTSVLKKNKKKTSAPIYIACLRSNLNIFLYPQLACFFGQFKYAHV